MKRLTRVSSAETPAFVLVLSCKPVIITLTESLLERLTATDGRILRDRLLCGFAVRANEQSRTFLIAASVKGGHVRMMLGYWPLMGVEQARSPQAFERASA